ncbi:Pycsar system effector family protein [Saccharopolyspora tripterygii]
MGRDLADGSECDERGNTRGVEVEVLRAELARADAAIARTDTKASTLLATFGPIVTVGAAVLPRIPIPPAGRVALWCALVLLMLAVLVLLAVVRPHLRGSGFRSRRTTDEEMTAFVVRITADPQRWYRQQLLTISRLGAMKFRGLRLATFLIGAGVITAVIAVAWSQP